MRKIICLQVALAASLHLPIAAEIISQDVAQDYQAPSIVTPVELPFESAPAPVVPIPVPVTPSGVVAPLPVTPSMIVPSVVAPPIQAVPALPVPAISSQPASPPYVPFGDSTIPVAPGSSTFYTPYGPGPGLQPSPLESRLTGPLGMPFTQGTAPAPRAALSVIVPGYVPGHRNEPLAPIPYLRRVPTGPRHFGEPTYLAPGVVSFVNGGWAGSDYLYNLVPDIGVAVELVLPKELAGLLHKDRVKQEIQSIFSWHQITPFSLAVSDLPPLPFFHLIAFVVPVKENYVVNIAGRLFEEAKLMRLDYQLPGTIQAITWEKQEIIISSKSQVLERLMESAREIAIQFAGKIDHFNRLQFEHKEELKVLGAPIGTVVSPFLHKHSPCCTD